MRSGLGRIKRWPSRDVPGCARRAASPARRPGRSSITTQCTGRTNCALPAPQRMRCGIGSASSAACTMPGSRSRGARAGLACRRRTGTSPLPSSQRSSVVDRRRRSSARRPSAARVGCAGGVEGGAHRRARALQVLIRLAARRGASPAPRGAAASRSDCSCAVRELGLVEAAARCPRRMPAASVQQRLAAAAPRCRSRAGNRAARSSWRAAASRRRRLQHGKPSASRLS